MNLKVLTKEQVEHFMDRGWVRVEQAYPHDVALAAQDQVWKRLAEKKGIRKEDPSTWTEDMAHLREAYDDEEFQLCNTVRFADAVEDLLGHGRLQKRIVNGESNTRAHYGWWPVNFSLGADEPWDVPTTGWHWDGIQFRHYVDSPDQGLLCLCMFSDIASRGGATVIAEGSHKVVAKMLEQYPDGLELGDAIPKVNETHPWFRALLGHNEEIAAKHERIDRLMNEWYEDEDGVQLKVTEAAANAGDVILCHPFLYHARTQNHLKIPRFMCNRTMPLKERIQLNREDADYSPLELSIRRALKMEQ